MANEEHQCEKQVYDRSGWGRYYQCMRRGTVQCDGKWYCTIHDPVYVAHKQRELEGKWAKEAADRQNKWKRDRVLNKIGEGYSTVFLKKVTDDIRRYLEVLSSSIEQRG